MILQIERAFFLPLLRYPVRQQNESNEENAKNNTRFNRLRKTGHKRIQISAQSILNAENRTPAKKCKQHSLHNEVFIKFMGNVSKVSLHKSLENSNNDYRYDNGVDQFQFLVTISFSLLRNRHVCISDRVNRLYGKYL